MTERRPDAHSDERAFDLRVQSPLRTAAGSGVRAQLSITNRSAQAHVALVSVLGSDAEWLPRPTQSRPLAPGETIIADVIVAPSPGTVPARYPLALVVEALDPVTGKSRSTQILDIELIVDAPGQIDLQISPTDATGVFGKRLHITVRNSGLDPAPVLLDAQTTEALRVSVPQGEWTLPPGETARLHGRVRSPRMRFFGTPTRATYTMTAHSAGAPRHIDASFTARAMFGTLFAKLVALLVIVSFWVTMCIIYIPKIADFVRKHEASSAFQTPGPSASAPGGHGKRNGSGRGGSGNGNGSGPGGNGNGTGSGPGGGNGNGGAGNGPGGGARGGHHRGATAGLTTVQLNGTVGGTDPSGVTVTAVRTGLVTEKAVRGTPNAASAVSQFSANGMIPAAALVAAAPTVQPANPKPVTTGPTGTWSFRVQKPGYYLLTFEKAGDETQRYVIDSSTAVATQPIKIVLATGQGKLQGTVTGPDGPVGNATVTITDGTSTITTSSESNGQRGHWSVDGLSTPSSYLVTVSKDGLGEASKLLKLTAGERDGVVDLNLKSGVTMLAGRVAGRDDNNNNCGVGGAQITVTDGTITRSTSTVTGDTAQDCRLAGAFRVPGLPAGKYTVTITARGFLVQTQRVVIKPGLVKLDIGQAELSSAYAQITGKVIGDVLDSEGNQEPGGPTKPKVDAGLMLTSIDNTYKLTSLNDGTFTFRGVAPGTYVLTAQYPDLDPASVTVKVQAGDIVHLGQPLVLRRAEVHNDATIQGFVGDSSDPSNTITCPPDPITHTQPKCIVSFHLADADGNPVPTTEAKVNLISHTLGALPYTLGPTTPDGFAPGLYELTISVSSSYLPAVVKVFVPEHGVGRAPPVNLTRSNGIAGAVTPVDGAPLDQSVSDPTYNGVNCVVALPIKSGVIPDPPTGCVDPGPSTCTDPRNPIGGYAKIAANGSYEIDNLCDASYRVFVLVTNPDFFGNELTPSTIAVASGITAPYSVQVSHKGSVLLSISTLGSTDQLTPLADASVTATCGTNDHRSGTTNAKGAVLLEALPDGSVHCSIQAIEPGASGRTFSGEFDVVVTRNQVSLEQVTLTAPIGSVALHIVTDWTRTKSPVDGATVTVSGVTSFISGQARSETVGPLLLTGSCVLVGHNSTTTADCPQQLSLDFVTSTLTVTVSAPGYQTIVAKQLTGQTSGANTNIVLEPAPIKLAAAVTVDPTDASVDLSTATIQVTDPSPAAGTVHVAVGTATDSPCPAPSGSVCADLTWTDSKAVLTGLPGNAMPGSYTLHITLAGYAPATVQVDCQVGADCNVPLITLRKYGQLIITTVDDSTDSNPVNDATVTLTATGQPPQTRQPDSGENTVRFPDVVPGDYGLEVHAAGYAFYKSTDGTSGVTCTSSDGTTRDPFTVAPGVTVQCTITLTKLGEITGTVQGVRALVGTDPTNLPQDALSGVRLSAQECDDQTCAHPSGPIFTAVTDADGTFTITGTTTDAGLLDGWWYIKPVLSGWTEPAKTDVGNNVFDVLNHETKTVTVHLFTRPVDFEILVLDASGNPVTSSDVGFTVRDSRSGVPLDAPTPPLSPASTACTQAHPDCHYWAFKQIVPTGYAISIHYTPIGTVNTTVTLIPGATPVLITVQGNATSGSVTGSVTALQGANTSPTPISGVTVALLRNGDVAKATNGIDDLSATTGNNGFIGIPNVPVSDTPYDVQVTAPAGYTVPTTVQAQVLVNTPAAVVPIAPVELVRVTHDVVVTVTTPSVDNLSTLVKAQLTPQSDPNPSYGTDGLFVLNGGSGSVTNTFAQVPFGTYTLRLTLPDDHRVLPDGCAVLPSNSQACTVTISVPNTAGGAVTPTPTFALKESKITFKVTRDDALRTDDRIPPATVTLTVQHGTSDPLYTDSSFAVSGSPASIWVPDDGTPNLMYHLTATPAATVIGWPAVSDDIGRASHTSTDDGFHDWGTSTLNLTESSASVTFTVQKHNGDAVDATAQPKIQITLPTGINGPDSVTTDPGGTKTITAVPFASGWSAKATIDDTNFGAAVSFSVDASNTTCQTTSTGTTTCAVTLRLPTP